MDYKINN